MGAESSGRPGLPALREGLLRDARGSATVEMALILPVALSLLGLVMIGGQGFEVQRKVVLAARTMTDLVSQAPYSQIR